MTKLSVAQLMLVGGYTTANHLGKVLGLKRSAVQRLKTEGVPILRADEFAVACGYHPATIWGDLYYQALRQCEADEGTTLLLVE